MRSASARRCASASRLRHVVEHVAHRGTNAVVAVALEIRVHEPPELRDQHLEPQVERAREARRLLGDDLVARVGQRARGRRAARPATAGDERDAAQVFRRGRRPRRGSGASSAGPASGTGVHHGSRGSCCAIASKPSRTSRTVRASGALHRHELRRDRALRLGRRVVRGHAPERRPQSGEAGAVRGVAHRARDVVAVRRAA